MSGFVCLFLRCQILNYLTLSEIIFGFGIVMLMGFGGRGTTLGTINIPTLPVPRRLAQPYMFQNLIKHLLARAARENLPHIC